MQKAGDHGLPGEAVVAEEAETSEAIHAAAHPGRRPAGAAEAGAAEAGETDGAEDETDAAQGEEAAEAEPEAVAAEAGEPDGGDR
jgi:hypothetical protein